MYLELAAGQYFQSGNITIWGKMCPYMKGNLFFFKKISNFSITV